MTDFAKFIAKNAAGAFFMGARAAAPLRWIAQAPPGQTRCCTRGPVAPRALPLPRALEAPRASPAAHRHRTSCTTRREGRNQGKIPVSVLAVDAASGRAVGAVPDAANAVEQVRHGTIGIEPQLWPLAGGELDRAAVAQRDRCAVRLRWAGEPREAVGGEGMRGDGRVHALGTMRRVLGGVVHVPDYVPTSLWDIINEGIFINAGRPSADGPARIYGPSSRSHWHPWPLQRVGA